MLGLYRCFASVRIGVYRLAQIKIIVEKLCPVRKNIDRLD
jgi:hypothetical protein